MKKPKTIKNYERQAKQDAADLLKALEERDWAESKLAEERKAHTKTADALFELQKKVRSIQ